MNDNKKEKLFKKLYSKLPTIKCKGLCSEACGPIAGSQFEIQKLEQATGEKLKVNFLLTCSVLTPDGKCSAYEQRPLLCRLYGLVKKMECPFGCTPSRWLTDQEVARLFRDAAKIGGPTVTSRRP